MNQVRYAGKWPLLALLDVGGNGKVWRSCVDGQCAAIKLLKRHDRLRRFRNEIEGMRRLQDIAGVLPIFDASLPARSTNAEPAWFAMALATPMREALGPRPTLIEVVSAIGDVASTLAQIHARGFSHRDIKPENFFRFDGRWCVGDFGLVAFAGMPRETAEGEKLGPIHYMAPEMLNEARKADGQPADVYSIAKTLWALSTGQNYPLPGVQSARKPAFQIGAYVATRRTVQLDLLLERCTTIDPRERPAMSDVANELRAWLSEPAEQPVGPLRLTLGSEWEQIAVAANRERDQVRRDNDAFAQHRRAKHTLERRFVKILEDVAETLSAASFLNVSGPADGSAPPGLTAWLPIKMRNRSVGIEVTASFKSSPRRPNSTFEATLLVRLHIGSPSGSSAETIHSRRENFLPGGAGEDAAIGVLGEDIAASLGAWVEAARARWEALH